MIRVVAIASLSTVFFEHDLQIPKFLGNERLDAPIAINDEAECRELAWACGIGLA